MLSQDQQRIALISVHGDPATEIGREEAGGQNVYVRQVGEALAALGWQVDMFTRRSDPQEPLLVEHNSNCRTIRLVAGPEVFVPRDQGFQYLPAFVEQFLRYEAAQNFQYPLVHTNYWLSSWVGMTLKQHQPLQQVHTYHSLGAVKYRSMPSIPEIANTRLAIEKTCLETAERIIATSPQEQEDMRLLVSDKGKIDIIPCGTDVEKFGKICRDHARSKLGIPIDAKVIFYIGRFDPRKGIETLVRAISISELRDKADLKLIIGGGSRPHQSDGKERERIGEIIAQLDLGDITLFPGRISDDALPIYYAAADACVFPSHYEPFGLVAIEAMASGTPVVVSDIGGLKFTVIPEETGLLCPPKDEVAFAKAIDRILMNPTWRDQLGKAGQQRVQHQFSWKGVAEQLNHLYLQLLGER